MSVFKKISDKINKIYSRALSDGIARFYRRDYAKKLTKYPSKYADGEEAYVMKWRELSAKPDRNVYRLFSQFIGPRAEIVPEDISSTIIQPILNPIETRPYYQDKNMFDKILGFGVLPETIIRCIEGTLYDKEYKSISVLTEDYLNRLLGKRDKVVFKPTIDANSGHGILIFYRDDYGNYQTKDHKETLDATFIRGLCSSKSNYIIQECLVQHPEISRYNPSSVNTLRVCTYRSVKDNKVHTTATVLRIGGEGMEIDNAHAGGVYVGVDNNGYLRNYAMDQYGNRFENFNGTDFKNEKLRIPEFDKVLEFAKKIGDTILHHRLIAHDIVITENGEIKLLEFNLRGFAPWVFQYSIGPAFGKYADEIIEYCAKNRDKAHKVFVEAF